MSDTVTATISSDGFVEVENGRFKKRISIKDYASVISGLVADEDQSLTESTFRYPSSIHSVTRTNQGYIVNLYFDEREATVRHTSAGRHTIYMPNVMIRVTLREVQGKTGEFSIGAVHWYATDRTRISLPTEWPTGGNTRDHIWTLPLPNMFGDARMCTGGNRLPSVIYYDWTVLDMLYNDVLIGSPFNNDLSICSVEDRPGSPGQWIEHLGEHYLNEETEGFPYSELVNY